MRVLILGATGMLGHKLAHVLSPQMEVAVSLRSSASQWPKGIPVSHVAEHIDVLDTNSLAALLTRYCPEVVLNAVGLVKQIMGAHDPAEAIALNALYPRTLAGLCEHAGIRLIHFSTDCVFSGSPNSARGSHGYREVDRADARDLYGMTKLLGEPETPGSLVLRTSIIGRELRGRNSLLEWFLAKVEGPVKGFTRALFTGVSTLELARLTAMLLRDHASMNGTWHVAAAEISKCDFLRLIAIRYGCKVEIVPDSEMFCDRRLDGTRFHQVTGWTAPPWPRMIQEMHECPFLYEKQSLGA